MIRDRKTNKLDGKQINETEYKQGEGNWHCDVTLCLAIKIDTKLRSIVVLCEIEQHGNLAGPARSAGFPLVFIVTLFHNIVCA